MRSHRTFSVFFSVVFLCAAASAATTAPANCTPFPTTFTNGTGGPNAVVCPAFNVPGGTLTAAVLSYAADYQFGSNPGPNTVIVTFVPAGPAGVTWSLPSVSLMVTGGQSSGAVPNGSATASSGVSSANFAAPYNVNITSSVSGGTVATSSGAASVVYTYTPPPAISLSCPTSIGTVGSPYSSSLAATGGVPPDTFSITTGSLPAGLTLNTSTGAITGTPTAAGTFSFTAKVVDSTGTTAGTATANCSITDGNIPTGTCNQSAATVVLPGGPQPEGSFLIRYVANINIGDSSINITNTGLNGASLLGPGFGTSTGNLCANIYTFSPDEQLVSCCSCPITPNALATLSVRNDLLQATLTQVIPTSVVVKLVASVPGSSALSGGMAAWGTSIHASPGTPGRITETAFTPATLSAGELAGITGRCASILGNGSGFGICAGCQDHIVTAGAASMQ